MGTNFTASAPSGTTHIYCGKFVEEGAISALLFPSNGVSGGDIRIVWDGAALLPRTEHTVIRKVKFIQQTGFYTFDWHSQNTGGWGAAYAMGTHPYPCYGTFDTSGNVTGTTGVGLGTHYYEQGGSNADHISTALSSLTGDNIQESLIVTKNIWVTQARVCRLINGGVDTEEVFYPDLVNNPDFEIIRHRSVASLGTPTDPAYYIGASDWTGDGDSNDETPSGYVRFIKMFSTDLSYAEILSEIALETNTPQTATGLANTHYMNINPTVADVIDQSASGNDPTWANANRPSDVSL